MRFRPISILAASVAVLAVSGPEVAAQTPYLWSNSAGGNWNVAGNWSPGTGPPGAPDSATINLAGTYTVDLTDVRSITNVTLNNATATVGQTASGTLNLSGTMTLSAGTWSMTNGLISGGTITTGGGSGRLLLLAGTGSRLLNVTVNPGVLDFSTAFSALRMQGTSNLASGTVLSINGGSNGLNFESTTTLTGVTVNLTNGNSFVGVDGNSTLTIGSTSTISNNTSGFNQLRSDFVVTGTSTIQNQGVIENIGTGTLSISPDVFVNQSGGTVRASAGSLLITSGGTINQAGGTFQVNGGTMTLGGANWVNAGDINLSSGRLNLGASTTTAGIGTINRTGGTVVITGNVNNAAATLGLTAATGTYHMVNGSITGGSITAAGGSVLRVGLAGDPVPNNNRLIDVAIGAGVLDFNAPSARVSLRGSTALATGSSITLNGGNNILAFDQLAGGTITLSNIALTFSSSNCFVSVDGNNTVTFDAASVVTNSTAGSSASINGLSGMTGATTGNGTVVNNGVMQNTSGTSLLSIRPDTFTNNGTLQATAGTLRVADADGANPVTFTNFSAGTLTGGTYRVFAANASITSVMDFQTKLIQTIAPGTTVELNGVNTTFNSLNALTTNNGIFSVLGGRNFTPTAGAITNSGFLEIGQVAGDNSRITANVTATSGGLVVGNGTIAGNLTAQLGSTVRPAVSLTGAPGRMSVTGNADMQPGSILDVRLAGLTNTDADRGQLAVSGTFSFAGTGANPLEIRVTRSTAYSDLMEATYEIVTSSAIGSTGLDGAPITVVQTGATNSATNVNNIRLTVSGFSIGAVFELSRVNNTIVLALNPVPEPALILTAGFGGLALWRWRRRSR